MTQIQNQESQLKSGRKIITPKIELIKPKRDQVESLTKKVTLKAKKTLTVPQELLLNRKSTPRPSILLLNKLGEGKMIQLDLESLQKMSKHNRNASRLSIKIANQIIKEERAKGSQLTPTVEPVARNPQDTVEYSLSEGSDDSDAISSVSSLQAADFEFLAESPEIKKCIQEDAIKVSSIKLISDTPQRNMKRFSILGVESSSKRPLQSTVAKQMMKNLLSDDLTKFIFVKIYGQEKLPGSLLKDFAQK